MNEAETRADLIDPVLKTAEWDDEPQEPVIVKPSRAREKSGEYTVSSKPCKHCEGKGYISIRDCSGEIQREENCSFCNGSGTLTQLTIAAYFD